MDKELDFRKPWKGGVEKIDTKVAIFSNLMWNIKETKKGVLVGSSIWSSNLVRLHQHKIPEGEMERTQRKTVFKCVSAWKVAKSERTLKLIPNLDEKIG